MQDAEAVAALFSLFLKDFPQGIMSRVRIKLFFFEEKKRVCTLASKFACVIALNDET